MKRFLAGLLAALMVLSLCACGAADAPGKTDGQTAAVSWDELVFDRTMPLRYAEQFSVEYAGDSYKRITINNDRVYLLVAEGAAVPDGVPTGVTVLQQPLDQIYLVAAAAMDYFDKLNAIDCITLSGKKQSDWYIQRAKDAMDSGALVYAGKYSEPDYELILSQGCDLAVENTMIYHSPAVLEQLERLGIPVLVETSSYETQPLGRMEWIKLYAALLDKEDEAEALFNEKMDSVADVLEQQPTGKTVAFFYITNTGTVNVRKSGDYLAQLIRMAGGVYVPENQSDGGENALSTMNIDMESFYAAAHDADVLIYNSTVDGELASLDELLKKSELLADFKAVQNGNVWCTGKNMFQSSMSLGRMIQEINAVLTQQAPDGLTYLHRLS